MAKTELLPALFEPVRMYVPYNENNDCGFNKDQRGNVLTMSIDGHHRRYHGTNNLFYGWQAYFDIQDGLPEPDALTAPMSSRFWRLALAKRPELFEVLDQTVQNEPELGGALYDFHMLARARQIGNIGIEHYNNERRAKIERARNFLFRTATRLHDRQVVESRQAVYLSQSLDAIFWETDHQGLTEVIKPETWCT